MASAGSAADFLIPTADGTHLGSEAEDAEHSIGAQVATGGLNLSKVRELLEEVIVAEPAHWAAAVDRAWWYKLSCFSYTALGIQILLMRSTLQQYYHGWFFTFTGLQMVVQGGLAYMADVHTFGRFSFWKVADAASAIVGSFLGLILPVLTGFGVMGFPTPVMGLWATCMAAGLLAKVQGGALLRQGKVSTELSALPFLRWHALWHMLPVGLMMCLLLLRMLY